MSMAARYSHGHGHGHYHHSHNQPDYFQPLHVDCSVEYELPECAKPPQGVKIEPLLMIHPCHFRNLERQRRRPFENNLPAGKDRPAAKRSRHSVPYPPSWEASCRAVQHQQPAMQEVAVYSCQALAAWGSRDCQQLVAAPLPCYEAV